MTIESRPPDARVGRRLFWAAMLALAAWNGYLLARDSSPTVDVRRVNAWVGGRKLNEAESASREILRRSPRHGEARMALARILFLRGDVKGGAEQLHEVPSWWPSKREALFLEGKGFFDVNLAARAESAWLACVRDDPPRPSAAPEHLRGAAEGLLQIYAVEGRWDEARAVLWQVYAQSPPGDEPGILNKWLQTHLFRIDPNQAAAVLRRFTATDPGDWQAQRALALAEQTLNRPAEADRRIEAALALRPGEPSLRRDRLAILDARGDRDGLRRVADLAPDWLRTDGRLAMYRGMARESSGDLAGALAHFERASTLRPFDEDIWFQRARVERRLGRAEDADLHHRLNLRLRAARAELPRAAQQCREALQSLPTSDLPDLGSSFRRMDELCQALGWPQAAETWRRLAR